MILIFSFPPQTFSLNTTTQVKDVQHVRVVGAVWERVCVRMCPSPFFLTGMVTGGGER